MKHQTSDIQSKKIGKGTSIWQYVVILPGAVIGNNCNINAHCFIENEVKIGNNVTIKCGVYLWDGITIEDNVQVSPNVTFMNDMCPRAKTPFSLMRTTIKKNASIGAGATILGGITIGEYALIGAGSVVTKNVPPYTVWYGNPAKHKGYITSDNILLDLNFKDKTGKVHQVINLHDAEIFKS
jgi:UDP-2-acetamido-3-amino-2,3-dideoxy-glucuronate N-acetyltransferase